MESIEIYLLLSVSVLCGMFAIYPYVIYGSILRLLPNRPIARDASYATSVTLFFSAYNEEKYIPRKLENIEMLKTQHPDLVVLAYDDGSNDDTLSLLQGRPDLLTVVKGRGRCGKAHGMKLLAQNASTEILLFTDANVILREDAIAKLIPWFGDPQVGGVCGTIQYIGDDTSPTAAVGLRYWLMEEKLKAAESATGNVMGADGSVFAIRRKLYPEFPDTVLDDMTVSMEAIFTGSRLIKADDVVAFERIVSSRKDEFTRKMRIGSRSFHTHLYLRKKLSRMGRLDKFKYCSHKFLRWYGGGFLIASIACFLAAIALLYPIAMIFFILTVIFFLLLAYLKNNSIFAKILEICLALVATQIGVFRAIRGRNSYIWDPAKSR